jgi:hypothetical protein
MARFGSKAVLAALKCDFRSTPVNGHWSLATSQLETKAASEPEWKQLELPF